MRTIGDYEWQQLSIWNFSPKNCIEKFIPSVCGKYLYHYYLLRIVEVVSDNQWKFEVVEKIEGVPSEVLKWRIDTFTVKR